MRRVLLLLPILLLGCAAAVSEPPRRPLRASWYHEGRHNADGSRFDPDGLSAAHRTLPLGTIVRVTHAGNGRSTIVTVRDRGPAAWTGKDIDLSRGAARQLGILQQGSARVRIEVVGHQ